MNNQSLYSTIQKLCLLQEISISAMCKKAGVSSGIITDLKAGRKKTITLATAQKLSKALNVSTEVLTGEQPPCSAEDDALLADYMAAIESAARSGRLKTGEGSSDILKAAALLQILSSCRIIQKSTENLFYL